MSCYVIKSDKLFLRCKDIHVIEVCEIDSLYIAPVLKKHWTHLATVQFGDGCEFEALQIGDRDIIRGRDLERLMQDLISLGIIVNREGLCFLKTKENNISDQCQVEYYRMFDLFDWSKYHVKSRLNTRWLRNDIVNGRPILDYCVEILSEKEAELKERINQHNEQLDSLNRNHSQDIKELKRIHREEIAAFECVKEEMEHKHCEDIEKLKRKHAEELAACECEQQKLKSNEVSEDVPYSKYFEDKLKLYLSRPCDNTATLISISVNLMRHFGNASPVWKFNDPIEPCHEVSEVYLPPVSDIFAIILVVLPSCRGKNSPKSYLRSVAYCIGLLRDKQWHFHHSEDISDTKLHQESRQSILFYDGTENQWGTDLYYPSLDDPEECPSDYEGWGFFYVPGYGFRFGFVFVTH